MPNLRESPGYWIATGLASLALCGPLIVGLAGVSGDGHRWVDLLAQFVAPVLVVTAVVLVFALALRLWPLAIVAGLVSVVLFAAVFPQWFPPRGKARSGAPVITLYSANAFLENTNAAAVAASIRVARPDIVVLVEVSPEVAARLPVLLPEYPNVVEPLVRSAMDRDTTLIASRWPLQPLVHAKAEVAAAATVAETPLGPLRLVATHLTRPWPDAFQWGQIIQARELARFVNGLPRLGTLIVGDFNSISSGRIGRQIQSEMGVIPAPGWPGTWPGGGPPVLGVTIDQVYRTPDLALLDRRVGADMGSDHWPVVTRLTLADVH